MHLFDPSTSAPRPPRHPCTALHLVLGEARRLHRAATGGSLSQSMPVLRRLHAAQVLPRMTLMRLHAERVHLQRKHVLRTLAVEAGYRNWEQFRPGITGMPLEAFDHFQLGRFEKAWGTAPNLWFSTECLARAHVAEHGGRVLRWGHQAVVVADPS